MQSPTTDLANAIRAVRAALLDARDDANGRGMPFEVGPVELQVTVAFTKDASVRGELKVLVADGQAGGGVTGQTTHQVKVTIQPLRPDGTKARIGDDPVNFH